MLHPRQYAAARPDSAKSPKFFDLIFSKGASRSERVGQRELTAAMSGLSARHVTQAHELDACLLQEHRLVKKPGALRDQIPPLGLRSLDEKGGDATDMSHIPDILRAVPVRHGLRRREASRAIHSRHFAYCLSRDRKGSHDRGGSGESSWKIGSSSWNRHFSLYSISRRESSWGALQT